MKKKLSKLLCVVLSLTVMCAFMQTTVLAQSDGEHKWELSKSKTAEWIEEGKTAQVTLSLPSAEEELVSHVLFVFDKSSCNDQVATQAKELLDGLKESISYSEASVKVSIVGFGGTAKTFCNSVSIDEALLVLDNIKDKKSELGSGTNMESGLEEAAAVLEADTEVTPERKHIILVSDGLPRNFNGSDGVSKNIFVEFDADGSRVWGDMSSWCSVNGLKDGQFDVPGGDWEEYFKDVSEKVQRDGDKYEVDFYANERWNSIFNSAEEFKATYPQGVYIEKAENSQHALSVDRAVYDAYHAFENLTYEGYSCYSVCVGTSNLGTAFMSALNKTGGKGYVDFDTIEKDICYLLDAGSTVKDVIGTGESNGLDYDFDLITDSLRIKAGEEQLEAVQTGENQWGFGKTDDGYRFSVQYFSSSEEGEYFVWYINEAVSNFAPVQLTYALELKETPKAAGDYSFDTNVKAELVPVDTAGVIGEQEFFDIPVLSYTVEEEEKPDVPADSSGGENTEVSTAPKTSGDNNLYAFIMTVFITALGAVYMAYEKRKA